MMLLLLVIIGVGLYFIFRQHEYSGTRTKGSNSDAAEIVKLRYAKGEIDEETYLKMMKILND